MDYGKYCPECKGTVYGNEFDYGKGICKDCVEEMKLKEYRQALSTDSIQESVGGQMVIKQIER